jgi:hypothetical protein
MNETKREPPPNKFLRDDGTVLARAATLFKAVIFSGYDLYAAKGLPINS